MNAALEERLRRYGETVLELGESPLAVDLRTPVSPEDREAILHLAPGPTFTVITAENPLGQVVSRERNAVATRELRKALEASGYRFIPGVGRAPDHSHREYGFAVAGRPEPMLDLAARFRQDAVFHFDGRGFLLLEVPGGRAHPLPLGGRSGAA